MDSLIARIKLRVADPLRAVDAAAWVHPRPKIHPPATEAEVDAAEAALGFPIPPLLRRLYREVGNGGFGPHYGLVGVPTIPPTPFRADIVVLYQGPTSAPPPDDNPDWVWPAGLVPLIGLGCNITECVDFFHAPYPVIKDDPNEYDWDRPLIEQLKPAAVSLADHLEMWVTGGRSDT